MGGHAFANAVAKGEPTLNTPRMSPEDYNRLKQIYLQRLQDCFPGCRVSCLIEAPGKTDYGDLDIKVCSPATDVGFVDVANRIGATGIICLSSKGYQNCTVGVPLDGSKSARPVVIYRPTKTKEPAERRPPATVTVERYAQIDLEVLSPDVYKWYTFFSSYGDLTSMLGRMVKHLGFTTTDKGLFLRFRELDESKGVPYQAVGDAEGMLFLSNEPAEVMRFLGLSAEKYEAGFETMVALYEWLAQGRLLSTDAVRIKRVNAKERTRLQKRNAYTTFFYEWLPSRLGVQADEEEESDDERSERHARIQARREILLQEAVDFFDKRAEYERMHQALLLKVNNQTANQLVKELVELHSGKVDKKLSEAVRPFRRWAGVGDGRLCILESAHTDEESQLHLLLDNEKSGLRDPEATSLWVKEHWRELQSLARRPGGDVTDTGRWQ